MSAEAFDTSPQPPSKAANISYLETDSVVKAGVFIIFERRDGEIVDAHVDLPTGERVATLDNGGIAQYLAALALPHVELIETQHELPVEIPKPRAEAAVIPLPEASPATEAS